MARHLIATAQGAGGSRTLVTSASGSGDVAETAGALARAIAAAGRQVVLVDWDVGRSGTDERDGDPARQALFEDVIRREPARLRVHVIAADEAFPAVPARWIGPALSPARSTRPTSTSSFSAAMQPRGSCSRPSKAASMRASSWAIPRPALRAPTRHRPGRCSVRGRRHRRLHYAPPAAPGLLRHLVRDRLQRRAAATRQRAHSIGASGRAIHLISSAAGKTHNNPAIT